MTFWHIWFYCGAVAAVMGIWRNRHLTVWHHNTALIIPLQIIFGMVSLAGAIAAPWAARWWQKNRQN